MKIKSITFGAIALTTLGILAAPAKIQAQPLNDRVEVNLPYSVTIGDKILQPGTYTIEELDSTTGKSPVLVLYGNNGMRFETSAMTIPALQNRTQPDTRVMLHHIGNDYYFDKIWIQGKDYGYEFVLPNSVKQRQNEASQSVAVAAAPVAPPTSPQPAAEPAPAAVSDAAPVPTPEPTPAQAQTDTSANSANREISESTPAPTPAAAAPAPPPPAAPELTPSPDSDETPAMPHTNAGWLMMLLSGGTLTGLGASLRRKR